MRCAHFRLSFCAAICYTVHKGPHRPHPTRRYGQMKVAIFTEYYFPFISGVVTHIQTLKEALEDEGHEVLIVTLDPIM